MAVTRCALLSVPGASTLASSAPASVRPDQCRTAFAMNQDRPESVGRGNRSMNSSPVIPIALLLAAFCSSSSEGQAVPRYRFGNDTLRYNERTAGTVVMEAPAGQVTLRTNHDADLAFTAAGTVVHAWYDQLSLRQSGPDGANRVPSTSNILKKPYVLTVSPNGKVQTTRVPAIPSEIAAMTDLSRQFDDFFITLPGRPLSRGTAWADTVVRTNGTARDSSSTVRHVSSYVVERDTVVAGVAAFLITVRQSVQMESAAPMPGQPMVARTTLAGDETGTAVFAPALGRLLSRDRRGSLNGTLTISGGPQPMALPQRYEYTSSISIRR
jgi:hypothetical protein